MTVALPPAPLTSTYRQRILQTQAEIRDDYLAHKHPGRMLRRRAELVDTVLCELWQALGCPASMALAAVGGYGRGELYPGSDIDLLFLLPDDASPEEEQQLAAVIGFLWDIGLEIGHSVRTVGECLSNAREDITVETALLEARLLTGSADLYERFHAALWQQLDPQKFFKAKRLEQEARYQRFQETPYSLEPHSKDSPGGLRDLHVILWIAKASGFGANWAEIEECGFITHQEKRHLDQAERFLQHLRIRLHYQVKRREDRLLFDYQTVLAEQLDFAPTKTRRPSERLMQDYYRNAKIITQLNTILLQSMGAAIFPAEDRPPQPINDRFQNAHSLLDVVDESVFEQHPAAILESFHLMQRHAELKGMTARTLRALWRARLQIDADYRANPEHQAAFLRLFQEPRGLVHEFRRMNQYSILGRYLPNFGKIVGQMQHDLFHVYTVDQHILQVMRNLRRFTMEEFAHEYPFCTRLMSEFEPRWVLYVAALFHDIAKGRGGDHSTLGQDDAEDFCIRHGMNEEDTALVVWLVGKHLTMSHVAQKLDVSDPRVVADFAAIVGNEQRLIALYLLTVADIRGTSPKVWNAWKGQLLEQLFNATRRILLSGEPPKPHGVIEERQREAMRLLRYFALSDTVQERLWKQLDTVYFLRHTAEEIAWHTRCLHYRSAIDEPVIKARLNPSGEGLQVMIYTRDCPDLFERLLGFFARTAYNIVDAKIHTTRHGYALDSFMLIDDEGGASDREMISYIEHELNERLRTLPPIEGPVSGRISRQVRHFPIEPEVSIEPDERGTNHVLSIVAADRPGLLYRIATALKRHGANLITAKIATLGERAEDTFLICGGDLDQSAGRLRLETELLELLKL